MPALFIAIAAAVALLVYEAIQIARGEPTITAQARAFQQRFPGWVGLIMLALGLLIGHLWIQ